MAKKIVRVAIKNFASIECQEVEFGKLTAIIGATDHGKTNIYRAIKWCLYNVPSGTSFIRNIVSRDENDDPVIDGLGEPVLKKAGTCFVEVYFDDGTIVERERGETSNSYRLINNEGKELELTGFGSGPIKSVLDFHGMREVDFLDNKSGVRTLNMSDQLNAPFYLSETAQTKAVMLGKIAKTEVADLAIKKNASNLRTEKVKEKTLKSDLKGVKDEIKKYKNLNKLERDIDKMKLKKDKVDNLISSLRRIDEARDAIVSLSVKKKDMLKNMESAEDADKVIKMCEELEKIQFMIDKLSKLNTDFKKEKERKIVLATLMSSIKLDDIDLVINNCNKIIDISKDAKNIKQLSVSYKDATEKRESLKDIIKMSSEVDDVIGNADDCIAIINKYSSIENINNRINASKKRLEEARSIAQDSSDDFDKCMDEYKGILKEYKKCPICANSITDEVIDGITV